MIDDDDDDDHDDDNEIWGRISVDIHLGKSNLSLHLLIAWIARHNFDGNDVMQLHIGLVYVCEA